MINYKKVIKMKLENINYLNFNKYIFKNKFI